MSKTLSERLATFRQDFKKLLGPKQQGYGELSQLEQPLVAGDDRAQGYGNDSSYLRQHGVPRPGGQSAGGGRGAQVGAGPIPSQSEELQLLCSLGREAAEILWEMAALQDETDATKEMLENGDQLKAQLRGMIGDYKGGDEAVLAAALEVFDLLSNTLAEYETAVSPRAAGSNPTPPKTGAAAKVQPPSYQQNPFQPSPTTAAATAPGKKPDEEAPLISFD
jgi:hypothetical protein